MDDLIGIVITAGLWLLFRAMKGNGKRQETQRTPRDPAPQRPPQQGGGWADILGIPSEHMPPTFREAVQRLGNAFELEPPAPPPAMQAESGHVETPDAFADGEGVDRCHDTLYSTRPSSLLGDEGADDCHDSMLPPAYRRTGEESHADQPPLPGWSLRLDAPSLVQGVMLSEILTRPALRRRNHPWRSH